MRFLTRLPILILCTLAAGAAEAQTSIDGFWLGTLRPPAGAELRVQITVQSAGGNPQCTLDSLDQSARGIPCANVSFTDPDLSFDVPSVKGRWVGKVSAGHDQLVGTWTQMAPLPLIFDRQQEPLKAPARGMLPSMPPVSASDMQAVLTRALEQQLKSGTFAAGAPFGMAVGVIRNGVRSVFTFGTAKADSLFEIGSITKTFTGLVLAEMIEDGKVKADTPVRELLPEGTVQKPEGAEITLIDLAAQHSGLPRMPDNFAPADPNNPYVDYDAAKLYAFMGKHGVARPADAPFLYSNLGVGLLGQALSVRAGKPYAQLIKEIITDPLRMSGTVITLTPNQQSRFIQGYSADRRAVHSWELDALAGAGAIRSTAGDMLTYLQAQLHPERVPPRLKAALVRSQTLQGDMAPAGKIAFNWMQRGRNGDFFHDGQTAGFTSTVFFNPEQDFAAVVLINIGPERQAPAALIATHIRQRLGGEPAVSLDDVPALRK